MSFPLPEESLNVTTVNVSNTSSGSPQAKPTEKTSAELKSTASNIIFKVGQAYTAQDLMSMLKLDSIVSPKEAVLALKTVASERNVTEGDVKADVKVDKIDPTNFFVAFSFKGMQPHKINKQLRSYEPDEGIFASDLSILISICLVRGPNITSKLLQSFGTLERKVLIAMMNKYHIVVMSRATGSDAITLQRIYNTYPHVAVQLAMKKPGLVRAPGSTVAWPTFLSFPSAIAFVTNRAQMVLFLAWHENFDKIINGARSNYNKQAKGPNDALVYLKIAKNSGWPPENVVKNTIDLISKDPVYGHLWVKSENKSRVSGLESYNSNVDDFLRALDQKFGNTDLRNQIIADLTNNALIAKARDILGD